MIVRIESQPLRQASQRALRVQGVSLIALGVGVLAVWNPVTRPGPKICLLRHAVGLPCPLCGMTRGLSLCLHGHPGEASLFNPLAVPVLLLAAVLAVKWAVEFVTGRNFTMTVTPRLGRGLAIAGYLLFFANWTYMLIYRREDPFATSWLGQFWTWMTG
jgi:hypothetical protein